MNGVSKANLQRKNGIRPITESLDLLRIRLGFENVKVLTPRAEIRLREGYPPAIPIKVECDFFYFSSLKLKVMIEFPVGYPDISLTAQVDWQDEFSPEIRSECEKSLDDFCRGSTGDGEYALKLCDLVKTWKTIIAATSSIPSNILLASPTGELLGGNESSSLNALPVSTVKFFSCRKCRSELFSSKELSSHNTSMNPNELAICTSVFLSEQLVWMKITENSGKIFCPDCSVRLGSWSWTGSKCSCKNQRRLFFPCNNRRTNFSRDVLITHS